MRSAIRYGGYVVNEDPETMIEDCVSTLKQNISLIIFPQGTRSGLQDALKFQRGAAHIALQAEVNITSVIILCDPPHLQKGERWYNIPQVRPHYRIIVGDEICPAQCVDSTMPSLASRQLTRFLERYFVEQQRIYSQS
jgi:1-acyl-sn-glycerol-3-phosphate acyltransferase